MSSGSKKVTIGYRYSLGEHLALVHGPVDKCTRLRWDERVAWEGSSTGGRIDVDAGNLFGGDKREGGVSGAIDFETGAPAQGRNTYLQARLGTEIPAFRGVASLVFRQLYLGNNPYLKPMDVRLQRIHVRQDGVEQWYDARASINDGLTTPVNEMVWAAATQPFTAGTSNFFGVAYGNGVWVAVAEQDAFFGTNQCAVYSTDEGRTWTQVSHNFGFRTLYGVDFDGTQFIAVGGAGEAYKSTNGQAWTKIEPRPTATLSGLRDAMFGGGVWLIGTNANNCARSTDGGTTWNTLNIGGTFLVYRLGYGHGTWFAVGESRNARRSVDGGATWTSITIPFANPDHVITSIHPVTYGGVDYWYAGGQGSQLFRSDDNGDTWVYVDLGLPLSVHTIWGVHYANELLLAVGSMGIYRSEDGGFTWAAWPGYSLGGLISLNYNGETWVGGGTNRIVYADQLVVLGSHEDMNPAHIIRECLTDPDWGMGYPEDSIDDASFTVAADQLFSEQMGISILWDRESTIQDFVDLVTQHIDAALYVSRTTGKFVLKLIRSDYNVATILELGEGEIERVDNYSRPAFGELVNEITVNYWDCKMSKTATVTAHNDALIQLQGGVIGTTVSYPGFTNATIAGRVALRDLNALSRQLVSCTIYANREAAELEIGDVFKLVWPDTHSGYIVMRVTGMAFGDGRTNKIRIECLEDVFALPDASLTVEPETEWVNPSVTPLPADTRLVIEAPYYEVVRELGEVDAAAQLAALPEAGWLTATADRPAGALNATLTVDSGAGYEDQAIVDFCPMAVLGVAVGPADTVWDITDPIALDELRIGSWAQIGNEIVRVDVSSDTSITVGRGCLDTVPTAHAANLPIFFAQDFLGAGETTFVDSDVLNAKLLPASGAGVVSIAQAATDVVTMDQRANRPYAPGNFQIDATAYPSRFSRAATTTITWAHRNRLQQTGGVIEDTTDGNIGPEAGTTYTVRLLDPNNADALIAEQTGISVTSAVFNTSAYTQTDVKFVLFSVRGGVASWQQHEWIAGVDSAFAAAGVASVAFTS